MQKSFIEKLLSLPPELADEIEKQRGEILAPLFYKSNEPFKLLKLLSIITTSKNLEEALKKYLTNSYPSLLSRKWFNERTPELFQKLSAEEIQNFEEILLKQFTPSLTLHAKGYEIKLAIGNETITFSMPEEFEDLRDLYFILKKKGKRIKLLLEKIKEKR